MGTYPKEKLVALDRILREQHERKLALKKRHDKTAELPGPYRIARDLVLPEPYVRRVAYECGLDPFPGPRNSNDIWLAAHAVVYLGWPTRLASQELGFTIASIENFIRKAGWKRYVLWGQGRRRVLIVPRPFADEKWRVRRKTPGFDTTGVLDRIQFPYFRRKRH